MKQQDRQKRRDERKSKIKKYRKEEKKMKEKITVRRAHYKKGGSYRNSRSEVLTSPAYHKTKLP